MTAGAVLAASQWTDPGGPEAAAVILAFLGEVGIAVESAPVGEALLGGIAIAGGRIRVDPAIPVPPGDLLHEAGHLAVVEPDRRMTMDDPGNDPGEEMAALAWSAAAAKACGLPLAVVFHPHGYLGGGEALATAYARATGPGIPMLAWFGMTAEPCRAAESDLAAFPAMARWLR
ncbi:MAG: hypothetical protein WA842_07930 [Croceibacterium sp.]